MQDQLELVVLAQSDDLASLAHQFLIRRQALFSGNDECSIARSQIRNFKSLVPFNVEDGTMFPANVVIFGKYQTRFPRPLAAQNQAGRGEWESLGRY
ncbi:MAG: hypothetical protein ND866_10135 [Pyrinomonadaceae bacterium]|nr:hypothetical protein [Pyrinomonadaceae bacterium]